MRMAAIAAAPNARFPFAQRSLSVFSRTSAPCLGPDRSHRCCRRRQPRGLPYVTTVRISRPMGGRPSPDVFGKQFHIASPYSGGQGGEKRAFAHPTDWFQGIDPPAHLFGRGPDIACSSPLLPPSRTARQPHPLIRRGPAFLTCRHPSARQHAVIEILIGAACLAKAAGLMFHHGTLSPLLFKGHVGVDVGAGQPSVARTSHQCQRHCRHRSVSHECPPRDGGEHSRFPVAPRKEEMSGALTNVHLRRRVPPGSGW
jgi:hypothetical protein